MQSETELSTMETKFIRLSDGLRTTIPLMNLLEVMSQKEVGMINSVAVVQFRAFD